MRLAAMVRQIVRLALPYFRSEERWIARALLAAVIAIELASVGITVLINQWYARFYDALQLHDWNAFTRQLVVFSALAGAFVGLAVYQLYLSQWLQIRWRSWMTEQLLDRWLDDAIPYRLQFSRQQSDNPDQRLSDDIRLFVSQTLTLGVGLLGSFVSLSSFVVILWSLSNRAPLSLFGHVIAIPGYLVVIALIYAVIGTLVTHWIGRPLVALNFDQQRYEADFRASLLRVRENAEQISALKGEAAERRRLIDRFANVIMNWHMIMSQQKKLTSITAGYTQASVIFPFVIAGPAYFAGMVQLGTLMQTVAAFGQVQTALSFFVSSYGLLAEWRAVVERLSGFTTAVANARGMRPSIVWTRSEVGSPLHVEHLTIYSPGGTPLVHANSITLKRGERALIMGPSGVGKSTLIRSLIGIWPYAEGRVAVPECARTLVLPQRSYLPDGSLRRALVFPGDAAQLSDRAISQSLANVGLPHFAERLDEVGDWQKQLSLGEQQRLSIARALLLAPDFLLLDEATSSLDERSERLIYETLRKKLPHTAIVSVGHAAALCEFHDRTFVAESVNRGGAASDRAPGMGALTLAERRVHEAAACHPVATANGYPVSPKQFFCDETN
jgi:putative ATP-binding cassette transporter